MDMHLIEWLEAAVRSGVLALAFMVIGLTYQTVALHGCRRHNQDCTERLSQLSVAVARLHGIAQRALGNAETIPPLDDLMSERRSRTPEPHP